MKTVRQGQATIEAKYAYMRLRSIADAAGINKRRAPAVALHRLNISETASTGIHLPLFQMTFRSLIQASQPLAEAKGCMK